MTSGPVGLHDVGVARNLGVQGAATPPSAVRAAPPGWRDPRLWIGIAIVALSVVAGARLLATADDTVAVWALTSDMGAGDQVEAADLVARQVRFADGSDLDRYFPADDDLPADLQLLRGVGEGELLPRAAVGSAAEGRTLQVPIEVEPNRVPPSVQAGSVVDVYVGAGSQGGPATRGAAGGGAALGSVPVVEAPPLEESFGTTGTRLLVLAVPEVDAEAFVDLLGRLDDPVIRVLKRS